MLKFRELQRQWVLVRPFICDYFHGERVVLNLLMLREWIYFKAQFQNILSGLVTSSCSLQVYSYRSSSMNTVARKWMENIWCSYSRAQLIIFVFKPSKKVCLFFKTFKKCENSSELKGCTNPGPRHYLEGCQPPWPLEGQLSLQLESASGLPSVQWEPEQEGWVGCCFSSNVPWEIGE